MKFRRIDEDTVRCIVSKEDMQEFGIGLEDFLKNKGKVHEFLHEIVERAEKEVGYEPKEGMLSMQIMPISQNTISITFSDHSPEGYEDMMNNFKDSIEGMQESMGDLMEEIEDDEDEAQIIEEDVEPDFDERVKRGGPDVDRTMSGMEKSAILIISMDSIEKMADFCRTLAIDTTVKSQLYEVKSKNMYSLIIEKGRLPVSVMRHIIILAVEYTTRISDSTSIAAYIKEHGELIIDKGAYRILKNYI